MRAQQLHVRLIREDYEFLVAFARDHDEPVAAIVRRMIRGLRSTEKQKNLPARSPQHSLNRI